MFKHATSANELSKEVAAFAKVGIAADHVVNIPFPWKDFPNFAEPCRMTVRGLRMIRDNVASGKTTFLHCTVGEDRTGYLAGLYRLLTESTDARTMFDTELCENGYSSGNPQKPAAIVDAIDHDLTPLFLKMAFKIARGELTKTSLEETVCDVDPKNDPAFAGASGMRRTTGARCRRATACRVRETTACASPRDRPRPPCRAPSSCPSARASHRSSTSRRARRPPRAPRRR